MRSLILLAALVFAGCAGAAHAQSPPRSPILTVTGHGHAEAAPDIARLTVEVVSKSNSLDGAVSAHQDRAPRAQAVLQNLRSSGVTIEHSTFRLDQVQQQNAKQPEFQAVTTFSLKLANLDAVNDALIAIAASGLFEIHNLQFGVNDERKLSNLARVDAVVDAKGQAEAIAKAAGLALGDIIEINTDGGARVFAAPAPRLLQGKIQVTPPSDIGVDANLTITWQARPKP